MLGDRLRRDISTKVHKERCIRKIVHRKLKLGFYQSPQWFAVICWNFIFHTSPCFTQTVLKC